MFPNFSSRPVGRRGSALVIVLAALVLVSSILIVFFQQSSLNRQISFSSAGQYRADILSRTALDTIVSDLRDEIVAGSTNTVNGVSATASDITIYVPTANSTAVPCRVGDQKFPNLIKQSTGGSAFWTGSSYSTSVVDPIRSVAGNATTAASINGRYIAPNRWNLPGLLDDPGSNATPKGPTEAYVPPDWIVVTRQGPLASVASLPDVTSLADKTTSNLNYVVGRYAYAIYDEGGLLDINVAGHPSSIASSDDFSTKRGQLPQVDLANIPGVTDANALVVWRNKVSAASAATYTSYVFNATNGFTTVAPGDQTFVGRRDLINYVQANSGQVSTSALPYLGTFSRELNSPSYTPPPLGSASRPATIAGQQAGMDSTFNPSLINLRVTTAFKRFSDGTQAAVGEPLIKYRFPLSRLALLTSTATADTSSDIYKYFGLTRAQASDPWTYRVGASSILDLSHVAAALREPDFFELLQAGVTLGSLGRSAVNPGVLIRTGPNPDTNPFYQVIQIGADLIDQYDADSYPTRILFDSTEFDGVENLPYLTRVFATTYRQPNSDTIGIWYQPEVWNPHAQASTVPSGGPSQFKFIATIGTKGSAQAQFTSESPSAAVLAPGIRSFASPGITFSTTSSSFASPTILSTAVGATDAATADNVTTSAGSFMGVFLGSALAPDLRNGGSGASAANWNFGKDIKLYVNFILQYQDQSGNWISYSQMKNLNGTGAAKDNANNSFTTYWPQYYYLHADPRTDRFGAAQGYVLFNDNPYTDATNPTIRPDASVGYQQADISNSAGPIWQFGQGYMGLLSENKSTNTTYYQDNDGITRGSVGAYADGNVADGGYPLATDNFNSLSSRPLILNRPFRSVADMGYAFRDEPWKDLDFFTGQSGDAALLDLFCVNTPLYTPTTAASTDALPEAGQIDLNTRQQPVLQAILAGAIKSETEGTVITPGTASEAGTLAKSLIDLTTAQPLLNRSELVTRWAPLLSYATAQDTIIKRRREAAIRALADVGNTRTWNLLIDVIAQSGRYTATSSNLNQFVVEGENRCWLHVAIDRYTGKVVSKYLEPVYE